MKKYRTLLIILAILVVLLGLFLIPKHLRNPEMPKVAARHFWAYKINTDSMNVIYGEVKNSQNISMILDGKIPAASISQVVNLSRGLFDLRMIRAGNRYALMEPKRNAGKVDYFIFEINATDYLVCDLRDSVRVYKDKKLVTREIEYASGTIKTSLWNAFEANDLDINLALKMADIFAWTIDFYGLQKNDHFDVIYENMSIDSTSLGADKVLAAMFQNNGRKVYGFWFSKNDQAGYFDENGQSLRRSFLKAPLKFSRISSHFTKARFHPILRIFTPHYGVDYAAPKGTPVVALGDGHVLSAGWCGGYGNTIKLRLNSVYTVNYGHLMGFAKGIHAGSSVRQGEVIGYVGSTGLSTGPHLDFRVYRNGQPTDPLKLESPPTDPVMKQYMPEYRKMVAKLKMQLDTIR
jgi:murein DD-endopeptidase MepM/ murein hydrolase activator NlpD